MSKAILDLPSDKKRQQLQNWKPHDVTIFCHHQPDVKLILHVSEAINKALAGESGAHPDILDPSKVNGFSGIKFRHFLNNVAAYSGINYLEIGTFCGSTLLSALYNNLDKITSAYAMDNWSEFGNHAKEVCEARLEKYIPEAGDKLTFYEEDCFKFDKAKIQHKINLYFYDGAHSQRDQEMAFTYYDEVLDDTFITIVDDWEQGEVRKGTLSAFKKLNYNVLASWQIVPQTRENKTENPDTHWWLGAFIAVIKKTKTNTGQVHEDN